MTREIELHDEDGVLLGYLTIRDDNGIISSKDFRYPFGGHPEYASTIEPRIGRAIRRLLS